MDGTITGVTVGSKFTLDLARHTAELIEVAAIIVIVMAISTLKATCVLMFFMHLKFEGKWKYVLLAPTTILAIGLPLALMPDISIPYYQDMSLQERQWQAEIDEEKHYEEEHQEDAEGEDAPNPPSTTDGDETDETA